MSLVNPVMSYIPPPNELGAPEKFSAWRDGQDKLFLDMLDCTKRFSLHNSPVGSGKSLAGMVTALATGKRVAYITESKSLQDQVSAEFAACGLFDMRGLNNYTCQAMVQGGFLEQLWSKKWGRPTCDLGPCMSGLRCDLKNAGCDYFDANKYAKDARLVLTNYAYWIAIHAYGQGLGNFDMVIFDEAHGATEALSSALSVEFVSRDFRELGTDPLSVNAPMQNWRMWARVQLIKVQKKLEFFTAGSRIGSTVDDNGMLILVRDTDIPDASELRYWKRLEGKCRMVSESTDDWVVERDENNGNTRLSPALVNKYAESALFLNIPRVILMSGTVRPKTGELLNIGYDEMEFTDYSSSFPVERRPIYWLPTVRLSNSSPESDLLTWVVRIDQILQRRQDRKGIIHTRSFKRQKFLMENSRFRDMMFANTSGSTRDTVKAFRSAKAPAVLVSPSVGTGLDFPYDACRYQIIGKMPFYDLRGALIQAQLKQDPDYADYLTARDLEQMYGRPNRAADDFSETFFIDDHCAWFIKKYSDYAFNETVGRFNMDVPLGKPVNKCFFSPYFLGAFQRIGYVTDPPRLEEM